MHGQRPPLVGLGTAGLIGLCVMAMCLQLASCASSRGNGNAGGGDGLTSSGGATGGDRSDGSSDTTASRGSSGSGVASSGGFSGDTETSGRGGKMGAFSESFTATAIPRTA